MVVPQVPMVFNTKSWSTDLNHSKGTPMALEPPHVCATIMDPMLVILMGYPISVNINIVYGGTTILYMIYNLLRMFITIAML